MGWSFSGHRLVYWSYYLSIFGLPLPIKLSTKITTPRPMHHFFYERNHTLTKSPIIFDLPYRPEQWFPPNRLFEFTLGIYLAVVVNKSKFYFLDNTLKPIKNVLKHISNFSFPYFLVHYAFIFLVKLLPTLGYSVANTLLIYFSVTISLSYIVQKLAKKLLIIDR